MLMNNLDPEVAERPAELVVYGGTGRAARSWEAFDAIVDSLRRLSDDETLLVQSGKPVGVFRTHAAGAPGADRELPPRSGMGDLGQLPGARGLGLTMYGQMTAGSWIYIGSQGIVQGTYECFADRPAPFRRLALGDDRAHCRVRRHGRGPAPRRAMNGAATLVVEIDPERIRRRLATRYLDEATENLDDALARWSAAKPPAPAPSASGERCDVLPALLARGVDADVLTDQTSAHDPLAGYVPNTLSLAEAERMRRTDPDEYVRRARAAIAAHCFAMVGFKDAGAEVFDYGNSLRAEAKLGGFERAFDYPGFVPAYIRPLFCDGKGPFRWVALSGDEADIAATDRAVLEEFADDEVLERWIRLAGERIAYQGLPARICWLGYGERHRLGLRFNERCKAASCARRS